MEEKCGKHSKLLQVKKGQSDIKALLFDENYSNSKTVEKKLI